MSGQAISYSDFEPDWWDAVGVPADAIAKGIQSEIEKSFGNTLPEIQKKALADAAHQQYRAQEALKASAAAAKDALQYADMPESPQYKSAMANSKAQESLAKAATERAAQIVSDFKIDSAIVGNLSKVAAVVGNAVNIAQIGAAAYSDDANKLGEAATSVIVGAAFGSLALAVLTGIAGTASVPAIATITVGVTAGFLASKVGAWAWNNYVAEAFGVKPGDTLGFEEIEKSVNEFFANAVSFIQRIDPLALDLDGDGIETLPGSAGVLFDFNGDGIKTGTGWVKGDDGFLVLDLNGNGKIDSGAELFGVDTVKRNGVKAENGFDALSELDSNHDGAFSGLDEKFGDVRVWRDVNQDGISQPNELFSLSELNITSINLNRVPAGHADNGNLISATGTYVKGDGTVGGVNDNQSLIGNLDLSTNPFYREFDNRIPLDEAAMRLPDLKGAGALRDLREASMLSAPLKSILSDYASAKTRGQQQLMLDSLIDSWSKSNSTYLPFERRISSLSSEAQNIKVEFKFSWEVAGLPPTEVEQKLKRDFDNIRALEVFNASDFFRVAFVSISSGQATFSVAVGSVVTTYTLPVVSGVVQLTETNLVIGSQQLDLLSSAYEHLKNSIYEGLLVQTRLKDYFSLIEFSIGNGYGYIKWDLIQQKLGVDFSHNIELAYENLQDIIRVPSLTSGMKDTFLSYMGRWVEIVEANGQLEQLHSLLSDQVQSDGLVWRLQGDSTWIDRNQSERIFGTTGADSIDAGAGNDTLHGGTGNDILRGGTGSDIYVFNLGDGQDVILDDSQYLGGTDVLKFGPGILARDIVVSRIDGVLVLTHSNGVDRIQINGWFDTTDDRFKLERIEFADGTVWDSAALTTPFLTQVGGDGDDVLNGVYGAYNEVLIGGLGNDTLSGYRGDDRLEGGKGNDTLLGGAGSDTYIFNLGDGHDVILDDSEYSGGTDVLRFGPGILASDIAVSRVGGVLVLAHSNGIDRIQINGWFDTNDDRFKLERIEFADGTVWDSAALTTPFLTQVGGDGDDVLSGVYGAYNEVLIGGLGNDTLNGYRGDDRLEGGKANDTLLGGAGSDTYVFNLGDGQDVILDDSEYSGGTDVLKFGAGILASDITLSRIGTALILTHINGIDRIQVDGWFATTDDRFKLERIEFSDGTVWEGMSLTTPFLELIGTEGDDVLTGLASAFPQIIRGGAGNDVLTSGRGNDLLDGGIGNDTLQGGAGSDTYVFNLGDGRDVILDDSEYSGGTDVLKFGPGILASDIAVSRVGGVLVLAHSNGNDRIQINGWFDTNDDRFKLERIEFADGTVWDSAALTTPFLTQIGGDGDDVLSGVYGAYNEVLIGGLGNDTLNGYRGDDRLEGGKGNDTLLGGTGSDTYVFNLGDGQDVIHDDSEYGGGTDVLKFGPGILASDIAISQAGNDLILTHINGVDRIQVAGWFATADDRFKLERIEFESGTFWTSGQASSMAATDGADTIIGSSIGERLQGGRGNDFLQGGEGSDTYIFARGDGQDVVNNFSNSTADIDTLVFEGVSPQKLWLSRDEDDLIIDVVGNEDRVAIKDWYISPIHQVDIIRAGSSALYANAVDNLVNAMASFGPPAGGEVVLTQTQQDQVSVVIAANWQ